MSYARQLFDKIPEPSVLLYNKLIKTYSDTGCGKKAMYTYIDMLRQDVKPDSYTFPFLLRCIPHHVEFEKNGWGLHSHVVKLGLDSNTVVVNSLLCMYSLCGKLDTARSIFNVCSKDDVFAWNAMFSGYNKTKRYEETKKLFYMMEKMVMVLPSSVTFVLILSACSKSKDLELGRRVRMYVEEGVVEHNLTLENALIDMYAACGEMKTALGIFENMKNKDVVSWTNVIKGFVNVEKVDLARSYFDRMPERDSVSWTAMITGYLRVNCFKEVLKLFHEMQTTSNVKPDEYTMVSVLTACAQTGALESGEWVKAFIDKNKVKNDVFVGNALLDMYFKCGSVGKAKRVFQEMGCKDKFTWTTMVVGLAINGHGQEALDMFSRMVRASIHPDEVTYIGVLSACTHTGLVHKGRKFFASMITHHGITPNVAHYGCMVDLLGRSGKLQEALEFITNMPIEPNSIVWGALLSACRAHKDIELAETAAKHILESDPYNEVVHVTLCNIYASCNRWDKLHDVRKTMTDRGMRKTPGCSLIEMDGVVHEFVAGDESHPRATEIYLKLNEMMGELKSVGYVADVSEVLMDLGEEEDKESRVYRHSEKLAMAFGLMNSECGVTIRIVKNLRMCGDCHGVAKLLSKVYGREVVVRDRTRFHHFEHGSCSCNDYW